MSATRSESPAAKVMDEAIELAIEERSPYPERCALERRQDAAPSVVLHRGRRQQEQLGDLVGGHQLVERGAGRRADLRVGGGVRQGQLL